VLSNYTGPSPDFISWLISIPYSLFGRSLLMAQSISLFFGIASVFLCWLIAKKLWDNQIANKAGWITALFPSLILYSVLFLREVYIVFFILLALFGVVSWVKTNNLKSFILAMIGFVGATFFHGAMMIGAIAFISIVGISSLKETFKLFAKGKINLKISILLFSFIIFAGLYLTNNIKVPYLGNFKSTSSIENLSIKTKLNTHGDASWPKWTIITSVDELFYKVPVRAIYFVFGPFPWDIKKFKHLIGMFDAFLYMYLVYLIISNIKFILKDPALRIVLIILLSYIVVFAVGVGNFGTSIRHRSKFVVFFILLAAQSLHKLNLSLKKKKFNVNY
jgi:4-amino-4-deoxy-L-arabinose transferase-like glycosyltransferase